MGRYGCGRCVGMGRYGMCEKVWVGMVCGMVWVGMVCGMVWVVWVYG